MEFRKARTEEPSEDEEPVVFDSQVSDDGRTLAYKVRRSDGTIIELAIPTRLLGVRFTASGIEALEDE